jgi:LuxR family maltose regulon positive regulatory protein
MIAKLNGGELRAVQRWLEAVPAPWYSAFQVIGLAQAGLFAFTGELDACLRCIDELERNLVPVESEHARRQLAQVSAVHCAIACVQDDLAQAETYAGQALRGLLDADDPFLHLVYGALGDAYRRVGRWEEAHDCYFKVLDLPASPTYRIHSVHALGALADLELQQGHMRRAAAYWQQARTGIEQPDTWGRFPLPLIGWVYIRMGEIRYEWNALAEAGDLLAQGLARAELGGDVRALIAGYLLAGRLKLAEGDTAAAGAYLEQARPLVENARFPDWTSRFERQQLALWLAQDRLRAATRWAEEMLRDGALAGRPESEEAHLAVARVLIVQGHAPALEQALAQLTRLLLVVEVEGRAALTIEALALQALAHWHRGDHARALTALERALRLAEPEGYVRLFADLGLLMARLLQEARVRGVMPEYVEQLLRAFGAASAGLGPAERALPEPLSSREQDVLELIAAGLTNREIAARLFISAETAKKHVANICAKLGVRNRTAAAARARELDWLR